MSAISQNLSSGSAKIDDIKTAINEKMSYLDAAGKGINNTSSQQGNTTLDKSFKTAVFSAVHTELRSIQSSTDIVVCGLPFNSSISDYDQVTNIFLSHLHINPTIKTTTRFGKKVDNRHQPLRVTLQTSNDVAIVLSVAKRLRQASNDYVRDNIFVNRYLTQAESKAAYDARVRSS